MKREKTNKYWNCGYFPGSSVIQLTAKGKRQDGGDRQKRRKYTEMRKINHRVTVSFVGVYISKTMINVNF